MFNKVSNQVSFPELEKRVLAFWNSEKIYDQSLEKRKDAPRFVFFEGPLDNCFPKVLSFEATQEIRWTDIFA